MKRSRFNVDKFITEFRWPLVILGVLYVLFMIIAPWIIGGWQWSHVQIVWDRWQGLNVGVLAFAASVIAFEITRYKEKRQRQREFLAARSFLPEALSEISAYLKASARMHMTVWNNGQVAFPPPPSEYKHVFANCIRYADSDTGEQLSALLSELLMWLQVHAARLESYIANPAHSTAMKQISTLDGLRLIGELQARVNKLFDFARGLEEEVDPRPLTWDDYKTAYLNLGLHIENLVVGKFSLEDKTKWHIEKYFKTAAIEDSQPES